MKKTLLLLALAASVGFAYADGDDTADKTVVFSNAEAAASTTLDGGGYYGFCFTLSDTPSRLDASFPTSSELTGIPTFTTYDLQSISIMVRSGQSWTDTGLYIVDNTNTVLAHSVNIIDSAAGGEMVTFQFENLSLQADATYRVFFLNRQHMASDSVAVGTTMATNYRETRQLAALGGNAAATATECGFVNDITAAVGSVAPTYAPVVTITAIIPEPATATLSLLALAGLAARRRR